MHALLTIAGGVALIVFGVRFLRKGLDRLFGPRLARVLDRMTRSRWRAFGSGLGIALALPSSTTISVLTVQAVRDGQLDSRRTLAVMLGANIGLTAMVVLISLSLEQYAPAMILMGVIMFQGMQRRLLRGIGQVLVALGFIFLAVGLIKAAAGGFEPGGDMGQLLAIINSYPFWTAVVGALLTVMLQSSTAAIALIIGLGASGTVGLPMALSVVVGANVGIALSTLGLGWSNTQARRLAVGNLLAKSIVGLACVLALPMLVEWVSRLPISMGQHIAVAHTAFNLIVAAVFLPLIGPVDRLSRLVVPDDADEEKPFGPRYITDEPIEGLALATGQSLRELLRLSEIVRSMLADMWRALETNDEQLARRVQERDDEVDILDQRIKKYLAHVAGREGDQDERGEIIRQLRYLTELETIGDVIDKNLAELAAKRVRYGMVFSKEGWAELDRFHRMVAENLLIAETAFATRDRQLAEKLIRHKQHLSHFERSLSDRHFDRLKAGDTQTHESSSVHLDLLTHLKRINSAVTHVAYAIVDSTNGDVPAAGRKPKRAGRKSSRD